MQQANTNNIQQVNSLKPYTCSLIYLATGEGFHVYIGIVMASGRQDAIKRFREHFSFFDKPRAWNYFKYWVDVKPGVNRHMLSDYISHKVITHIQGKPTFENIFFEMNFASPL